MKRPFALAGLAAIAAGLASLSACAQLLGIEPIQDDAADASTPIDASLGRDGDTDAGRDGPAPPDDAGLDRAAPLDADLDAPAPDTGPTVDPARGCTGPDGGPAYFFPNVSAFPSGLAIDRAGIYVADVNSLRRCSIEGCSTGVTLVYPSQPVAFTTDPSHVVYCAAGNVTISESNGTRVSGYLANEGCQALAAHGADLYWGNASAIRHGLDGAEAGTPSDEVTDAAVGPVLAIAPTSRWLFFLDRGDPDASAARVVRCDLPSCAGGAVVLDEPANGVGILVPSMAANERTVYWSDPARRRLLACDVGGCQGAPRVVVEDASVATVHADEAALYWATSESSVVGAVYETPLDGGATVTLATNQHGPDHITANAACVYWTTEGFVGAQTPGQVVGVPQP